ncbi:MAG TPA: transposase family protein [Ignavibacteriaceae bacterium]
MIREVRDNYIQAGHPTAFSAPGNIKRHYGNVYGVRPINETLQGIDSYTIRREFHKPRTSNCFYIYHKRQQIQMDLIEMIKLKQFNLKEHNDGIVYLLTCIDSFTKFVWIRGMKNKTAKTSLAAIKSIINAMGDEKPESIFFDRGGEFRNNLVKQYLNTEGITLVHPNSEKKAAIVERYVKQKFIYKSSFLIFYFQFQPHHSSNNI